MHDIDRTQLEASETELGGAQELGEFAPGPAQGESTEGPLHENLEIELATELLEVGNEFELEQFLGNLLSKVGSAVGSFVRSDTGQALGGILKSAAKQALPVLGRGIGQMISSDRGGDIGASAGQLAGQALGLELEGLSHEDREFATARQLVRLAASAVRRAALAPTGHPVAVARRAFAGAARTYAPGLLQRLPGRSSALWPRGGRWTRRGRTIVLFGG
jgi:hypothetical protein